LDYTFELPKYGSKNMRFVGLKVCTERKQNSLVLHDVPCRLIKLEARRRMTENF